MLVVVEVLELGVVLFGFNSAYCWTGKERKGTESFL